MATLRMTELATTDVARSDAFQRKQALRKPASTRTTSSKSDRPEGGARVLRVLVVDAKQESANALVRQVRNAGHVAHAALDGIAALRVAAAWYPDVVLLDLEMPLMDGCQVARHLRLNYSSEDCLIIAFVEQADDARRKPCMEAGIDLLLTKPVDSEVVETLLLLECVRVNRPRAREAVNKLNHLTSTGRRRAIDLSTFGVNHVEENHQQIEVIGCCCDHLGDLDRGLGAVIGGMIGTVLLVRSRDNELGSDQMQLETGE